MIKGRKDVWFGKVTDVSDIKETHTYRVQWLKGRMYPHAI